ncbi:MAG: hypothetical protein EZS28_051404 [Streblomastix strix]|uniref:Uncharacterized protein n=1 Tax=Streblomastix strix TaxID=222440 RepID=A0A5J4T3P5_9EUKA|nr:MAG: hypothetical protein EZS28_051404 [Streblomastix strix]
MSKQCLRSIHSYGNEQVQVGLVTNGFPRALVIVINTAGGNEQEQDWGIYQGLNSIKQFIREILKGRETNPNYPQTPLPPQPVLFKSCQEQIVDEGAIEEIEAQLVNKGRGINFGDIKEHANQAKGSILNIFIDRSNPKPFWYN